MDYPALITVGEAITLLFVGALSASIVYRLCLEGLIGHSQAAGLAKVPGPRFASWSRLWMLKALASGRSHEIWLKVNRTYGSLARIGPNHVITDDPKVIRDILAVRSEYVRGPWFDSIRVVPTATNIVSERDPKKHSMIRAKLSPSFSGQAMTSLEPVIDVLVANWINTIQSRQIENAETQPAVIDIGRRIQYLTVDIITRLCLGSELGCVSRDTDCHDLLKSVELGNFFCQHFSVILELNKAMRWLAKVPKIAGRLIPKSTDEEGVGKLMSIIEKTIQDRTRNDFKNDVVSSLLRRDMLPEQITTELVVALVAGSDTTSTSIQSTLLAIISNSSIYQKVKNEIRMVTETCCISFPIQQSEFLRLPYLQACILEGIRKFPPLSQLRERVVPQQGAVINGHFVPGGTYVGINMWGSQLNKQVFGNDADLYRPERWLTPDQARQQAMKQTLQLVFGHGSTKCLGMPMAIVEIHKVIFELLHRFDISLPDARRPWKSVCYGIFFQKDFNVNMSVAKPANVAAKGSSAAKDGLGLTGAQAGVGQSYDASVLKADEQR